MSGWLSDSQVQVEQAAEYRALAERGELLELSRAVMRAASAPSATWRRAAPALVEEAGPEAVRAALPVWSEPAALDRTVPLVGHRNLPFDVNTRFGACNSHALRGLGWTLGLLPVTRETIGAVAALVEISLDQRSGDPPRALHMAEAGIVALALTGDRAAREELETPRGWVGHQGTLPRIDKVLAKATLAHR
ncbi:hypothetical protein AB0912_26415 [Streptomyces sp. NPDC007084]|uniref:hypothetical protein n=1 Tax=Streptomyces sp. NPDC007084 TaxID=3154313 RepID=UPI00345341AF